MSDDTESKPPCTDCELVKLRFDYAWKWFSYHADQRTKMFNYMLIAMGVFATATVGAFNNGLLWVAFVLCLTAAGFAYSFWHLDKRNEELVRLGEEVLAHLERTEIFLAPATIAGRAGNAIDFGILRRQALIEAGMDQSWQSNALRGKHRFWLQALAKLVAGIFLAGAVSILYLIVTDP